MRNRYLILLMALTAVILYAAALPLWEGWDEPFHFGYVEAIQCWHEVPVLGKTAISKETEASFFLAPLPRFLSDAVPGSTSFAQQAGLNREERIRRRSDLSRIPTQLRREKSAFSNYEAQQAPLAYLILAPLGAVVDHVPLIGRVLLLRFATSIAGITLTFLGVVRLLLVFRVEGPLQDVALACILSSQVLWASVAHVGNDWLAIPLAIWFMVFMARAATERDVRTLLAAALMLGLGLLTKAYFLAFVPILSAFIIQQCLKRTLRAVPAACAALLAVVVGGVWYARNLLLYRTLAGTQEANRGTPFAEMFGALVSINWLKSGLAQFRSALWCGNWSFTPFPKGLLNVEMIALVLGVLLYAFRQENRGIGIRWVWAAFTALSLALVYQTCAAWVYSHGALTTTEPWYCQGILPCIWAAAFAGLKGRRWLGFLLATSLSCLTAAIAAITYLRFVIPGYASGIQSPTMTEAWEWWNRQPSADLTLVSLPPPAFIYALLTVYLSTLLVVTLSTLFAVGPRNPIWDPQSSLSDRCRVSSRSASGP